MESKGMTAYLVLRLLFGVLDICTDIGLAVHLYLKGEPLWGSLTLLWLAVGLLAALAGVTVGRCRTGDSMSCYKFSLLTLKLYVEVIQGFFISGKLVAAEICETQLLISSSQRFEFRVVEPELQRAASFGRSRNAMRLRLRRLWLRQWYQTWLGIEK
jgi:hypothetical protein